MIAKPPITPHLRRGRGGEGGQVLRTGEVDGCDRMPNGVVLGHVTLRGAVVVGGVAPDHCGLCGLLDSVLEAGIEGLTWFDDGGHTKNDDIGQHGGAGEREGSEEGGESAHFRWCLLDRVWERNVEYFQETSDGCS